MQIEKRSGHDEQLILTSLIVDKAVLGRISSKWKGDMFRSKWSNLVASWCIKYFSKYEKAPSSHIESLFESWATESKDKEVVVTIEKFLQSLSNSYKQLRKSSNSNYVIDLAGRYFNQVRLERLTEIIQGDIQSGQVEKANERITTFSKIDMGVGQGINIFQDVEAIKQAFQEGNESLIIYPGALGKFFGSSLSRDSFISFEGPEKSGKTWWLLDIAFRAVLQRRKVAFFDAGDMSESQIIRRFMIRASHHPIRASTVQYPTSISIDENSGEACVATEERKYRHNLEWRRAKRASKFIMRKKVKSKKSYLKLSCHPSDSLTIANIRTILKDWEREEWTPDVIVIDYADILCMDYYGMEGRDKINKTWSLLRGIAQIYHCLVITATQSDANSYDTKIISKRNFSEDKRKNAHVAGMIGLNTTTEEKENDVMRLNWVIRREEKFSERRCVYAVGCLDIGNPAIQSTF